MGVNIKNLPYQMNLLYSLNDKDFYYEYADKKRIKLTKKQHEQHELEDKNIDFEQMYEVCGYPEEYDFFKGTEHYKTRNWNDY